MAKKNFVGFLKRTGKGIKTGVKKTGKFIEHEKEAFSKWKEDRRQAQVVRHKQHLEDAKKHFKEEFDELGRQRALLQMRNELEQQKLEHARALQQMKTDRLQMGLQRDLVRKQIREVSPRPVRKAFGIAKDVFFPSREEILMEKEGRGRLFSNGRPSMSTQRAPAPKRASLFPRPESFGLKSNKEILAEIDRKAGLRR
jgi:hypothetical protein